MYYQTLTKAKQAARKRANYQQESMYVFAEEFGNYFVLSQLEYDNSYMVEEQDIRWTCEPANIYSK